MAVINSDEFSQSSSDALEHTIDFMTKTTNDCGRVGLCPDPRHYHSFRAVPFIMLPIYTCSGCGKRIQSYVSGSSLSRAAVQCTACGVYAHRKCAFSKHVEWQSKCPSVVDGNLVSEDDGVVSELNKNSLSKNTDDTKIQQTNEVVENTVMGHDRQNELAEAVTETKEVNLAADISIENKDNKDTKNQRNLDSIFRTAPTEAIDPSSRGNYPAINTSISVDNVLQNQRTLCDVQCTKANFPFLSSVSLLRSRKTTTGAETSDLTVQKCQTWNGIVESPPPYNSESHGDTPTPKKQKKSSEQETRTLDDDKNEIDETTNEINANIEIATTAPLHFASQGFRVFSRALQENILIQFNRLVPKNSSRVEIDDSNCSDSDGNIPELDEDDSPSVVDVKKSGREEVNERDETDDLQARSLLEMSEPQNDSTIDRKRIGLATVAGTIVGGVVGVGLAGPVGGVIGVKCGQTAGMLGLLLEGSVTASVLASGISVGMAAGQHIQEINETRILTLGEGTKQRVLLMVRPTIQAPEPIWDELYQQAKRSYSGNATSILNMLIPNESQAAKRERYEREVDIVETEEDELAIADKVLLLVSRILSNKESLPGHVYRKLLEAFRCRCREQNEKINDTPPTDHLPSKNPPASTINDDEDRIERNQRRRDAHAVIKYVTTSLLLTRPGFGHSPSITEKTATAVECLVFGEIYDLVLEEIELEYQNKDNLLLDKIAQFESQQNQRGISMKDDGDSNFGYRCCISEAALTALHSLPQAHSAVDKLRYCVEFLEQISESFSKSDMKATMGADSLLKMVCQHILIAKVIGINSQIAFLEEFARDEQLLRGREGYALVTLQASLHFLNASEDFNTDIFHPDEN